MGPARADERPTARARQNAQAAAVEKVEGAANLVPSQSVEAESAAPPQEEVVRQDSAPAFNLAPHILLSARLTGMQLVKGNPINKRPR
jgi:hypothetical protein